MKRGAPGGTEVVGRDCIPILRSGRLDSVQSLALLAQMYMSPEDHIKRIIETLHMHESSIVRVVTYELDLPPTSPAVAVPVLTPQRRVLVDNLQIEPYEGVCPWTLNRVEGIALTRELVEFLCVASLVDRNLIEAPPVIDGAFRLDLPTWSACRWISGVAELPDGAAGARSLFIDSMWKTPPDKRAARLHLLSPQAQDLVFELAADPDIVQLALQVAQRRMVFVPIEPRPDRQKITISYESPHFANAQVGFLGSLRRFLNHSAFNFSVDVPLANAAPSYHFRMRAPDGNYIRTRPESPVTALRLKAPTPLVGTGRRRRWRLNRFQPQTSPGAVQGVPGSGSNYAHVYFSRFYREGVPQPALAVSINERPAGSIGSAAAHLTLTLAVLVGIALLAVPMARNNRSAVDAAALLTTTPGIAALVLFGSPKGSGSHGSSELVMTPLTAQVGLIVSVVASLMGAILTLATVNYVTVPHDPVPLWLVASWGSVLLVMWISASYAWSRLTINMRRYRVAARQTIAVESRLQTGRTSVQ